MWSCVRRGALVKNVVMTTDDAGGRLTVTPSVELRWSRAAVTSAFIITVVAYNSGMKTIIRRCYNSSRRVTSNNQTTTK